MRCPYCHAVGTVVRAQDMSNKYPQYDGYLTDDFLFYCKSCGVILPKAFFQANPDFRR